MDSELTRLYDTLVAKTDPGEIDHVLVRGRVVPTGWFLEQAKRIQFGSGFNAGVICTTLVVLLKCGAWLEWHDWSCGVDGWVRHEQPKFDAFWRPEELDVAMLLREGHMAAPSEAYLDGVQVGGYRLNDGDGYGIWREEAGKVVVERHDWDGHHIKPEHERLILWDGHTPPEPPSGCTPSGSTP